MIARLDGTLCKVLLSKRMMWAWKYWWIESVRVGNDCTTYVRVELNTKACRARKAKRINYI
jgi:hypothetical protein